MIVWSLVLYSSLEDLRCEEQKKKCQKRWPLKTHLKLLMTKEHFRKEVKWKRLRKVSGTLTRVDLNVPSQQYDYCKTLGEGWELFFNIKAQHNLLIVIKTMVLQTLQTLSYLKLTQSFGKMSLSAAAHFLIYVGTPCSCNIPAKNIGCINSTHVSYSAPSKRRWNNYYSVFRCYLEEGWMPKQVTSK